MHRTTRSFPMIAVAALVLAACGGDDDGGAGASIDAGAADGTPGETGDTDNTDGAGGAEDAADPGDGSTGEPSEFLADALHPIELPEADTAVITLAGETYVFEGLEPCRVTEVAEGRFMFQAVGTGELADGSSIRLEVRREVVDLEQSAGSYHEWDFLQFSIQQEPGGEMWSTAWNDTTRVETGGPVRGHSDTLPNILVVDDGTMLAASSVAELRNALPSAELDRAGEGIAEIAVVCG